MGIGGELRIIDIYPIKIAVDGFKMFCNKIYLNLS